MSSYRNAYLLTVTASCRHPLYRDRRTPFDRTTQHARTRSTVFIVTFLRQHVHPLLRTLCPSLYVWNLFVGPHANVEGVGVVTRQTTLHSVSHWSNTSTFLHHHLTTRAFASELSCVPSGAFGQSCQKAQNKLPASSEENERRLPLQSTGLASVVTTIAPGKCVVRLVQTV